MWNSLKKLIIANPMGAFVYGIIGKWYIMIMVAGLVVTFWVFKGLEQTGIMQSFEKILTEALDDTKSVAKNCTPKILNLGDFWECLSNPPKYEPSPDDASATSLEQDLKTKLKNGQPQNQNPYDSDQGLGK